MVGLATHGGRIPVRRPWSRAACLVTGAGLFLFTGAVCIVRPNPDISLGRFYAGYGAAAVGCALIFIGSLRIPQVPRRLAYLGKISFGLYVFHIAMLELAVWLTRPLGLRGNSVPRLVVVDGVGLALSIVVAHFSYRSF